MVMLCKVIITKLLSKLVLGCLFTSLWGCSVPSPFPHHMSFSRRRNGYVILPLHLRSGACAQRLLRVHHVCSKAYGLQLPVDDPSAYPYRVHAPAPAVLACTNTTGAYLFGQNWGFPSVTESGMDRFRECMLSAIHAGWA